MQRQVHNAVDAGEGDLEIRARLDADPANLNTRLELAHRCQQKALPDIALEHLRLAVECAPASADAAVALGTLLRDTGHAADGAASLTAFAAKHQAVLFHTTAQPLEPLVEHSSDNAGAPGRSLVCDSQPGSPEAPEYAVARSAQSSE
jgi:predicted dinucleotide-utilizing enzyme